MQAIPWTGSKKPGHRLVSLNKKANKIPIQCQPDTDRMGISDLIFFFGSYMFFQYRNQDIHINRFGDMVVHSDKERFLTVLGISIGSHGDDRNAGTEWIL